MNREFFFFFFCSHRAFSSLFSISRSKLCILWNGKTSIHRVVYNMSVFCIFIRNPSNEYFSFRHCCKKFYTSFVHKLVYLYTIQTNIVTILFKQKHSIDDKIYTYIYITAFFFFSCRVDVLHQRLGTWSCCFCRIIFKYIFSCFFFTFCWETNKKNWRTAVYSICPYIFIYCKLDLFIFDPCSWKHFWMYMQNYFFVLLHVPKLLKLFYIDVLYFIHAKNCQIIIIREFLLIGSKSCAFF